MSNYTSSSSQERSFPTPQTPPLSIVLYVLCNNLQSVASPSTPTNTLAGVGLKHAGGAAPAASTSREERMECLRTLRAFSELLESENVPPFVRERIVLQVGFTCNGKPHLSNTCYHVSQQLIDPKELLGPSSGCSGQLRALAFSVYTRCRPHAEISIEGARSLTTFGPIADRLEHSQVSRCVFNVCY